MPANKDRAIDFLQCVARSEVDAAYERHVAGNFIHHNPFFRGDADSLRTAMRENATKMPGKQVTVLRAIEEGDFVAVHSRMQPEPAATRGVALVHIFRFVDGRIAELWDVGQPEPEQSPNEYGMF